jgi:hypothetical protein
MGTRHGGTDNNVPGSARKVIRSSQDATFARGTCGVSTLSTYTRGVYQFYLWIYEHHILLPVLIATVFQALASPFPVSCKCAQPLLSNFGVPVQ